MGRVGVVGGSYQSPEDPSAGLREEGLRSWKT